MTFLSNNNDNKTYFHICWKQFVEIQNIYAKFMCLLSKITSFEMDYHAYFKYFPWTLFCSSVVYSFFTHLRMHNIIRWVEVIKSAMCLPIIKFQFASYLCRSRPMQYWVPDLQFPMESQKESRSVWMSLTATETASVNL